MVLREVPQASYGTCAHVNQFSICAVINYQLSGLKQLKFIILQFCRSEVLYGYHWTKSGCQQGYIFFFFFWRSRRRFYLQDHLGCWQNSVPCSSRIKDSFLADGQLKAQLLGATYILWLVAPFLPSKPERESQFPLKLQISSAASVFSSP